MRSRTRIGLLVLRVGVGLEVWIFHMRPKLVHFDEELRGFPDPVGWGPAPSFALALAIEGLGSILVAIGWQTRFAALSLVAIMVVVLALAAAGLPQANIESASHYALVYGVIAILGADAGSLGKTPPSPGESRS